MNKKKFFIIIVIALVVFSLAYIKLTGGAGKTAERKEPPGPKPAVVKMVSAVRGNINPSLTLSGSVAGDKEIVLTAKTQGIVTRLGAKTGHQVAAGQVVVVLESNNQQLTLEKSREQVTAASLTLDKAKVDFSRINELYKLGAVSKADFDNAEIALKTAQVAYNVALSDSQLAGQSLRDTRVAAPFTGSVVDCFVEEGEMVFPGSKLMTVVSDSGLKIKANLTAEQLKLVSEGQQGVFTTGVFPGKQFACAVKSISSKASSANLTYAVELTLSDDAGQLKSGMFGHVKLDTAGIPGTTIPRDALVTRDESGDAELFVVRDGRASKKKIKTGMSDDKNIIVLGGLEPGEKVVTFGQSLLKDGTLVTEGE